nr:hypothetical protein [Mycobacterium tuberculosis]
MSGNFSNGLLWRGDHEGLFSLFYSLDVPRITIVDAHLDGGFGPVVLPPIPVPAVNAHLTGNVAMGAFTIPQIDIPALTPNITGSAAFRIVVGVRAHSAGECHCGANNQRLGWGGDEDRSLRNVDSRH